MKLRQFLNTCNTNTAEIEVYNRNNKLMYTGTIYLIFHNTPDNNGNELSDQQRQELLDSTIYSWELNNFNDISIYCEC